jgi:hypothetical protein
MMAPSIMAPTVTYFHDATNNLRASATIAGFLDFGQRSVTRAMNQRLSARLG